MIRFSLLCLALSAAPALAACPEMPAKLTYNSGAVVEVVSRDGDRISYRQTLPESGKVVDMTLQAGIYTITATRDGEGAVFEWKAALPTVAELVPGASFRSEAILTTPGFMPPRPFTAEVQVVGAEDVTVAGCTYPVLKVVVQNNEGGKKMGDNTKWIHLPSLLTLKSQIVEGGDTRAQEAVAIE